MAIRKTVVCFLMVAVLSILGFGTALADPGADEVLVKKGEDSDSVILLQLRLQDLGFYNYKITGFFGDFTEDALMDFQQTNNLTADGVAGQKTISLMYSNSAKRKEVKPYEPKTTVSNHKKVYGALVDWSRVNSLWKIGMRCKVVDLDTGITYYMKRCNRSYSVPHADVAPATKADTNKMKQTFGGELNAYRRAVVVYIGGQRIAGSLYGEPHGSTGVPGNGLNKSDGTLQQVCIHFLNSRNNVHHMIDPAHQYQVKHAAGKKPAGAKPPLVYPGD